MGLDINSVFTNMSNSIGTEGTQLQNTINSLGSNMSTSDMLNVQFQMGQFNAKVEALSTITKSIQDMLKSLAQRAG